MQATMTTSSWKTAGLRGLLALVVGSALLLWPGVGMGALALTFGVMLGLGGAMALTLAWRQAASTETRLLLGFEGFAMLFASGACVAYPAAGLMAMVGILALWLVLEGGLALRLAWAVDDHELLLATLGVLCLGGAVGLIASPAFGALTVLALTAADFLVTGALLVSLALRLRSLENEGWDSWTVATDHA